MTGVQTCALPIYTATTEIYTVYNTLSLHDALPICDQGWGLLTAITLPGGSELGLYQPRHPTATQPS